MDTVAMIADAHTFALRKLTALMDEDYDGLTVAARKAKRTRRIDGAMAKKLCKLDVAYSVARHITEPKIRKFKADLLKQLHHSTDGDTSTDEGTGISSGSEAPTSAPACAAAAPRIRDLLLECDIQRFAIFDEDDPEVDGMTALRTSPPDLDFSLVVERLTISLDALSSAVRRCSEDEVNTDTPLANDDNEEFKDCCEGLCERSRAASRPTSDGEDDSFLEWLRDWRAHFATAIPAAASLAALLVDTQIQTDVWIDRDLMMDGISDDDDDITAFEAYEDLGDDFDLLPAEGA